MIIKNLSHLKKAFLPGVEFEILLHNRPKCLGQIRRITKANTAGFYSIILSEPGNQANIGNNGLGLWLDWGPARWWSFDAEGVCARYTSNPDDQFSNLILSFKILGEARNEVE